MVLQLHVWGPAFGLPSLDAECLAVVAFVTQTISPFDYELIASSPSAVPTQHLPTLYDPKTSTWTTGFSAIIRHLRAHPPPSYAPPPSLSPDVDPAKVAADNTAYTAFLTAHAAPLLALSLYVSSANYGVSTRPAYSSILPFPLPWTEPPTVRAAMLRRAAHLGITGLDTDAEDEGKSDTGLGKEEDWVNATVPASLRKGLEAKRKGVVGMLAPEAKRRIRLEGAAKDVLDVLDEVDWTGPSVQMLEVRCLAWGYLALMALPEVPRGWLGEVLRRDYPRLVRFVEEFRELVFVKGPGSDLPWATEWHQSRSAGAVLARFVRGVLGEVPVLGELWRAWWTERMRAVVLSGRGLRTMERERQKGGVLVLLGAGLMAAVVSVGVWWYRSLPSFGEAVQVWRRPVVSLSSFGAAGALFSGALYGV